MGGPMSLGLIMGGLNAVGALASGASQSAQMRAQANAQKAQAKIYELEAKQAQDLGRVEAQKQDEQKARLRRQFEDTQARDRSLLAAGGVDMTSGSALDTQAGNIESFSQDMADNAYAKAMKEWETRANTTRLQTQAANARAQSEALQKASHNAFPSLLNAVISGGTGFASGYSLAGGSFKDLWNTGSGASGGGTG